MKFPAVSLQNPDVVCSLRGNPLDYPFLLPGLKAAFCPVTNHKSSSVSELMAMTIKLNDSVPSSSLS